MERGQLGRLVVSDRVRGRLYWAGRGVLLSVLPQEGPQMDHMRGCAGRCIGGCDLRCWIHLRSHGWGGIERPHILRDILRQLPCADTLALRCRDPLLLGRSSAVSSRPQKAGSTLTGALDDR